MPATRKIVFLMTDSQRAAAARLLHRPGDGEGHEEEVRSAAVAVGAKSSFPIARQSHGELPKQNPRLTIHT